jgi:hypothetical protein
MSRNIALYIKDILQNMREAVEFIHGMSYEQFIGDKRTLNAVLRSIEVIGEAARNVPDEIRVRYPDIPWKEMAYVEAKWGSTSYIHCVKDDQLYDYIVENKKSKKLDKKTIESISHAFLALAKMDKDFVSNGK